MNRTFFFLLLSLLVTTTTLAAPTPPTVIADVPPTDVSPTVIREDMPTVATDGSVTACKKFTLLDLPEDALFDIYSKLGIDKFRLKLANKKSKELSDHFDRQLELTEFELLDRFRGHNQNFLVDEEFIDIFAQDHSVKETDVRQAMEVVRHASDQESVWMDTEKRNRLLKEQLKPILRSEDVANLDALMSQAYQKANMKVEDGQIKELRIPEINEDDRSMDMLFLYMLLEGPMLDAHSTFILFESGRILRRTRRMIDQTPEFKTTHGSLDNQMIKALVPFLEHIADENKIRTTMEQARNARSIEIAVGLGAKHALCSLVASTVCPVSYFLFFLSPNDKETVKILCQHLSSQGQKSSELPSFWLDLLSR